MFSVVLIVLALFPKSMLTVGEEQSFEGFADQTFQLEFFASHKGITRIFFQQISTTISVEIFSPSGNTLNIIDDKSSLIGSFILPVQVSDEGHYQVRVKIHRVFDKDTRKTVTSNPGIFKVTVLDLLTPDEFTQKEERNRKDLRVKYLEQNAVPLQNISPEREDFSDLHFMKDVIGEAQVVMLGEQTHSTAETFTGKLHLIRFLHEEMGFDVLAFESDLFGNDKFQSMIENQAPDKELNWALALRPWCKYNEFNSVIEYIKETNKSERPIITAGFDSQITDDLSVKYFTADLRDFLVQNKIPCPSKNYFSIIQNCIEWHYSFGKAPLLNATQKESFNSLTQRLISDLKNNYRETKNVKSGFFAQVMQSLTTTLPWMLNLQSNMLFGEDIYGIWRDKQMGDNITWLANHQFANQKIIIWAASNHLNYNHRLGFFAGTDYSLNMENQMGKVVKDNLGDRVYSIAFISFEGFYGNPIKGLSRDEYKKKIIEDQVPGLELEEMFVYAGFENAFLDLRPKAAGAWLEKPFPARPYGHSSYIAPWPKVVDAFLFIRKVNAVTLIPDPK